MSDHRKGHRDAPPKPRPRTKATKCAKGSRERPIVSSYLRGTDELSVTVDHRRPTMPGMAPQPHSVRTIVIPEGGDVVETLRQAGTDEATISMVTAEIGRATAMDFATKFLLSSRPKQNEMLAELRAGHMGPEMEKFVAILEKARGK